MRRGVGIVGVVVVVHCSAGMGELYTHQGRFGVSFDAAILGRAITDYPYHQLGSFSWYLDGQSDAPGASGSVRGPQGRPIDYVPVAGGVGYEGPPVVGQVRGMLQARPGLYPPGTVWQIGSEPGRDGYVKPATRPGQDRFDYVGYATAFHAWQAQIREADPTFRVMLGAAIPGRQIDFDYDTIEHLDMLFGVYHVLYGEPMPVDVFNLRLYAGRDAATVEAFTSAIVRFRTWMNDVPLRAGVTESYRDRELWLTAYGLAGAEVGEELPAEMMAQWTDWLAGYAGADFADGSIGLPDDGDRLVQRWAWFALDDPRDTFADSRLFEYDGTLTPLGRRYATYLSAPEPAAAAIFLAGTILVAFRRRSVSGGGTTRAARAGREGP